jgi:hypothetical protein
MKHKTLFLKMILTLVLCSSVYSQSRNDTLIFLERTSGGTSAENQFFDENLSVELAAANYSVTTIRTQADFILIPTVVVEADAPAETPHSIVLRLVQNNPEQTEIIQAGIAYDEVTEMYQWNLYLIYQVMANVPMSKAETAAAEVEPSPIEHYWRDKWIYLSVAGIYNPQYIIDNIIGEWWPTSPTSFTGSVGIEVQFLNFLSMELRIRPDILYYEPAKEGGGPLFNLALPLSIRFIAKPGDIWMLEPYLGAAINIPLSEQLKLPPVTILAGIQAGVKLGSAAAVFFGLEFDYDYEMTYHFGNRFHAGKRVQMLFSIGVKFGFNNRS